MRCIVLNKLPIIKRQDKKYKKKQNVHISHLHPKGLLIFFHLSVNVFA